MRRDTRFQKSTSVAEAYDPYLVNDGYEEEEEEVAATKWNWGKKTVMVPNPWGREVEESYDFDVTKLDKLFDFLLEKGQIKLPDNHIVLPLNSWRIRSTSFIMLLLIPLMSAEFSGSTYRGLFSKGGSSLIRLER